MGKLRVAGPAKKASLQARKDARAAEESLSAKTRVHASAQIRIEHFDFESAQLSSLHEELEDAREQIQLLKVAGQQAAPPKCGQSGGSRESVCETAEGGGFPTRARIPQERKDCSWLSTLLNSAAKCRPICTTPSSGSSAYAGLGETGWLYDKSETAGSQTSCATKAESRRTGTLKPMQVSSSCCPSHFASTSIIMNLACDTL